MIRSKKPSSILKASEIRDELTVSYFSKVLFLEG